MKTTDKVKIYKCSICGNVVLMLEDSSVIPVCCGTDMDLSEAKTTDEYHEKHVPVITKDGNHVTVTVGGIIHPMTEMHYIKWILLETTKGVHRENLVPDTEPAAHFTLEKGEEVTAAFAYCNLHGLWKGTCC